MGRGGRGLAVIELVVVETVLMLDQRLGRGAGHEDGREEVRKGHVGKAEIERRPSGHPNYLSGLVLDLWRVSLGPWAKT